MQTIIQTLKLVDNPESIAAYRKIHNEIWPEIKEGIKSVGISKMDLYLSGNTVVMHIELPDEIDFDEAMQRLSVLPRQSEWEDFVGSYQECEPGSTSAAKWNRMEKFFQL